MTETQGRRQRRRPDDARRTAAFEELSEDHLLKKRFDIIYAPSVKQHLRSIAPKYHSLIRKNIEAQLQSEPDVKTKNRKPLEYLGVFDSEWEIRFGPDNCFRVFYKTDKKIKEVYILAIGVKQGNRLGYHFISEYSEL